MSATVREGTAVLDGEEFARLTARSGPSCSRTATGCSARSTTPRTWCRRPCPRVAGLRRLRGPRVVADLAVPDRHQRVPSGAGEPRSPAAAVRPGRSRRRDRTRPLPPPSRSCPGCSRSPTHLFSADLADPASVVGAGSSVRLALIAALQYLPPRQRAVLILRDVLRWRASETADLLGTTTTAVNSMLRRARTQLSQVASAADDIARARRPGPARGCSTSTRRRSRTPTGPPSPGCCGRTRCSRCRRRRPGSPAGTRWSASSPPGCSASPAISSWSRSPPTASPAFAAYLRDGDGRYRAHAVQVLTLDAASIARVVSFNQPELFAMFGLPPVLPR